ncbi:hypothetical protein HYE68_003101 [Fusarium pseudograminearum]|nr:hypothetical protein HYE68_003101 [Fusarium pseudograminearum]
MPTAKKSTSQAMDKIANIFRNKRPKESNSSAVRTTSIPSENSPQVQSEDVSARADSEREVSLKNIETRNQNSQVEQASTPGLPEVVSPTHGEDLNAPKLNPTVDAKIHEDDISPPQESKSTEAIVSSIQEENQGAPETSPLADGNIQKNRISPSLRSKASTGRSIVSQHVHPLSTPSWTREMHSEHLWSCAYDRLKEEKREVIKHYESVIFACHWGAAEGKHELALGRLFDIIQSSITFADSEPPSRTTLMSSFVDSFLIEPNKIEPLDTSIAEDSDTKSIDSTVPASDEVESNDLQNLTIKLREMIERSRLASIPWVASCLALEGLVCSAQPGRSPDQSIILDVICKMEWYVGLSELVFRHNPKETQSSDAPDKNPQELALISLYKSILSLLIHAALCGLEVFCEQASVCGDIDESALDDYGQEMWEKEEELMNCNTQNFKENVISWLDISATRNVEALSSTDSTQLEDLFKSWNVAKQAYCDSDPSEGCTSIDLCHWLQTTPEFKEFVSWGTDPRGRILWLDEDLGTGKTELTRVVCKTLSESHQGDVTGLETVKNLAWFFCDSSKSQRVNAVSMMKSLIFHVVEQQPFLSKPDIGQKRFDGPNDFYALSMVFYSLLRDEKFQPTYFVINASSGFVASDRTDLVTLPTFEHQETATQWPNEWGLNDILSMMTITAKDSDKIRWLVSFNSSQHIGSGFASGCSYFRIPITEDMEVVREILATHSASSVSSIAKTEQDYDLIRKEMYERMSRSSNFNLLWINTALNITRADPAYWNAPEIFQGLMDTAPNIDALYEKAQGDLDKLRTCDSYFCLRVLDTVAVASRPLLSSELQGIVDLPEKIVMVLIQRFLPLFLRVCKDEVSGGRSVHFVHPSAKDFVRRSLESSSISNQHAFVADRCLSILIDSFNKEQIGSDTEESPQQDRVTNEYATLFWILHFFQMNEDKRVGTIMLADHLVQEYRTQWLETIASYGKLQEVLVVIESVNFTLQTGTKADTEQMNHIYQAIQDIGDFIRAHLMWTRTSPGPGYSEATIKNSLIFWPSMSPPWLALGPTPHKRSHTPKSCLHVLEHPDWVRSCAFSPCGRLVATGSDDHSIRLWDTASGTLQHVLGDVDTFTYDVVLSRPGPKGQSLLAACGYSTIKVWDLLTGQLLKELRDISEVEELDREKTAEPDGFTGEGDVASNDHDGGSRVDQDGKPDDDSSIDAQSNFMVESIDISPKGDYLVAIANYRLVLWEIPSFKPIILYETEDGKDLKKVKFSSNGQLLAASLGAYIFTLDVSAHQTEPQWFPERGSSPPTTMPEEVEADTEREDAAEPNEAGSESASSESKVPEEQPGHSADIYGLCFSPEEMGKKFLASGSDDGTVRIWDLEKGETQVVLKHSGGDIDSVSFSADGSYLATASTDFKIRIWKQMSRGYWGTGVRTQPGQVFAGHSYKICSVDFAPQGYRLASGACDSEARIWEIDTLQNAAQPGELGTDNDTGHHVLLSKQDAEPGHSHPVVCVSMSSDGVTIASGCRGGYICLWDGITGAHRLTMTDHHEAKVTSLVFSNDGKTLVSTSMDESAFVWDVYGASSKATHHLESHNDWLRGAAISPDGKLVATGSDDRTVRVWDISAPPEPPVDSDDKMTSQVPARVFEGHEDYVYGVAFSPNTRHLASVGDDGMVLLWDLAGEGNQEQKDEKPVSYGDWWRGVVFTPDSNRVLTVSSRGVVVIWNLGFESAEETQRLAVCDRANLFTSMHINQDQPDVLLTNSGAWEFKISETELDPSEAQTPPLQLQRPASLPIGVTEDGSWITWNDKKLILLPMEFRPADTDSCSWAQGRSVAVGCKSGQVLLFRLSENASPEYPNQVT